MSKKISRGIAAGMLLAAVCFVFYAFGHPEASFTLPNSVVYVLYAVYLLVMIVQFIAPFRKK